MNKQATLTSSFNTEGELKILKSENQKLMRMLDGIKSLNTRDPDFISKLIKYQKNLPSEEIIQKQIENYRNSISDYIACAEKHRISHFNEYYNQFVETLQKNQVKYRIISKNIRVEEVEIQIDQQRAKIRVCYNKSAICPWSNVWDASGFDKIYSDSINKLTKSKISDNILSEIFLISYQNIRNAQKLDGKPNFELVPIYKIHEEMILGLLRNQMKGKNGLEKRYKEIYFPEWAFKYNLDNLKNHLKNLPSEKQVIFKTGSQAETEKNGVIMNGLNPFDEYKKNYSVSQK